ncbi:MAG: alpha-L-fucosidase [Verrucomicrobia bacterium]|nr:alpha-L-fucosidase [Verrucomicrobiota bacterium]
MTIRQLSTIAALCALSSAGPLRAESRPETEAEHDARMGWFREARFGMFIHWGLYSVPAGEWKGKKYGGGVEWIQDFAKIPVSEYTPLIQRFNPVKYDADAWVRLAKEAGMKYLVITSKHHEGFCLWPSAQTDWDVASTPYGKDLLRPLAEACAKHGVRLCFYHSIMDWHHPEYGEKAPWRGNHATEKPDMDKFTAYMKAQLDELLAYKPGILWFDGEWEGAWTHERGKDLYAYLRAKDPALIINNRVDKGRKGMTGFNAEGEFKGDYCTPEQEIPASGLPGVDWESCMTMNGTWGYSAHDHNWKSPETLIRNLIDIASKGGNYLLNVGPTAEGLIPDASVERLKAMGAWMKTNGEAIHGTQANPFPKAPAWGRVTSRKSADGNTRLYLHVFNWPQDGKLTVPGLTNEAVKASFLAKPAEALAATSGPDGIVLTLPSGPPDPVVPVIALDIKGSPSIR